MGLKTELCSRDVNVTSKKVTVTVTRYFGKKVTVTVTRYIFKMSNEYALRNGVTRYLPKFLTIHSLQVGLRRTGTE